MEKAREKYYDIPLKEPSVTPVSPSWAVSARDGKVVAGDIGEGPGRITLKSLYFILKDTKDEG